MKTLVTFKASVVPTREIQFINFEKGAVFTGAICQYAGDEETVQLYTLNPANCEEVERRRILCVGTGWQVELEDDDELIPIGIARSQNGDYVWHLYEVVKNPA